MTKKIIFILILLLVVAGLAGTSLLRRQTKQPEKTEKSSPKKTIKDWLTNNQGAECRLKTPQGEITVLTKANKVKIVGQIGLGPAGGTNQGAMINDGQYIYLWNQGETKGIKYPIESTSTKISGPARLEL